MEGFRDAASLVVEAMRPLGWDPLHWDQASASNSFGGYVRFFGALAKGLPDLKPWIDDTLLVKGHQMAMDLLQRVLLHHHVPNLPFDAALKEIRLAAALEEAEATVAPNVAKLQRGRKGHG